MRKSEVIVIKIDEKVLRRIPIELPWNDLEEIKGFIGNNVIMDITGVLDSIEQFKQIIIYIKNCTDGLDGKLLNKQS